MKVTETFFAGGQPRGRIERDEYAGVVGYIPRDGEPDPPARSWDNVDDLKAALVLLYENSSDAGGT